MTDFNPHVRRAEGDTKRFLAIVVIVSSLLLSVYLIFIPRTVTIETTPSEAKVFLYDKLVCEKTPCDITFNRTLPYFIGIQKKHHKVKIIEMPIFGALDKQRFNQAIVLDSIIDPQARKNALAICQSEREKKDNTSNIDAEACYRLPPVMPYEANSSGHCQVVFDIGVDGNPTNIKEPECTEKVFEQPTLDILELWEYLPARKNGIDVIRRNTEVKLTFRLTDESGELIPELKNAQNEN